MIDGHCDLDILLDPFFMHFPGYLEVPPWFPDLGSPKKNLPNLAIALDMLDTDKPWRNQYQSSIAAHPGSSIARLTGKFFPS